MAEIFNFSTIKKKRVIELQNISYKNKMTVRVDILWRNFENIAKMITGPKKATF